MTYLLLQTFLLLLSAYFLGAFVACIARRVVAARPARLAPITVDPVPVHRHEVVPLDVPRPFERVQPKIEVLPRPERRTVVPVELDISRFERALIGPDPNEGMPRNMIVEIMPAVLESPTGPPHPFPPVRVEPVEEPIEETWEEPVAEEPESLAPASLLPDEDERVVDDGDRPEADHPAPPSSGAAMATAAAAAAVSAARSAGDTARHADDEVEEPFEPEEPEELVEPEEAEEVYEAAARQPSYASAADDDIPTVSPPIEGGDDLQSIRAIDAETEQRLKSVGVMTFDQIARWSGDDIELYGEELNLGSRIDEEQWIEQAQILAMGGDTYYSRSRSAALGGDALDAEDAGEVSPEADQAEDEAGDEVGDDAASGASAAGYGMAGAAAAAAAASQAMGRDADADESGAEAPPVEEDIEEPPAPEVEDVAPSEQAPAVPEDLSGSREGRSVAEMAAAAAAAMAAASASVTRGLRPIEPISPLSRVNPNIVLPAKLSDAIREHDSKAQGSVSPAAIGAGSVPHSRPASTGAKGDDLKRIRGIGVLIERQLNVNGITRYQQIANWSSSDIAAISAKLDFKGRIERENWVEQARILSSGGETEFSKRVDRGDVESSSGGEETS